jgi:hypothetical protein
VSLAISPANAKLRQVSSTPKASLIGVGNDGCVIGIEEDYRAVNPPKSGPQKPGCDSDELFLRNLLSDALGGEQGHS